MTVHTMRGGPFDGHTLDLADHTRRVAFSLCTTSTGGVGRSLAELEPEVRFDYETGAIVAPVDLVLGWRSAYYIRTPDGFIFEEAGA
jgi:hypothetical protein